MNKKSRRNPLWLPLACLCLGGCIESQSSSMAPHFETHELDAVLAIVVDMSGSFAAQWDEQAYQLFLALMDQYFTASQGDGARVVLCQLSDAKDVVLFEGSPADLRTKFRSPEELNTFLAERSDPGGSPVYQATNRAVEYVLSVPGVGEQTRLMTVVLSDLKETAPLGQTRTNAGLRMVDSLKRYQEQGGGLALYCVEPREQIRWRKILHAAGFTDGAYSIQNTLVANPQLPRFD